MRAARLAPWLLPLALAPGAAAHAGGSLAAEARFALPPWAVWLTGGLVVMVSFLVVGAYLTRPGREAPPPARAAEPRAPRAARALGLLGLALVAAHAASPLPGAALPGAALWLLLGGLLPMVAYTWGNPWPALSPFRALAPLADALRRGAPPRAYPARLGAWPSVALLLGLMALEAGREGLDARAVGALALAYALFTVAGMAVFGSAAWLARAEVFERAFAWWGAAALRRRAAGLRAAEARGPGEAAFVVALLFMVNYDGLLATGAGRAALDALGALGQGAARGALLLAGYAVFLGAFWACVAGVRRAAESLRPMPDLAARVAPSLVPIAVGYHAAHNLFYVVEQAPRLLASLDDPLGRGSALLGGLGTEPLALPMEWGAAVGAAQLGFILLGHVLAVVVAHHLAWGAFPSRIQAVRSEGPLTAAMVFYTLVGLGLLSAAEPPAAAALGLALAAPLAVAALRCARCGEAFARPQHLALHRGRAHGAMAADEASAFASALAEEEAWLAGFRRHMRGALAALPAGFFFLVTLILLDAMGLGFEWVVLVIPGTAAFGGLLYYFAWSAPEKAPRPR